MSTLLTVVLPAPKFPDEVLDYEIDWSEVIAQDDQILSVSVDVAGGGDLVVDSHSTADLATTLWISGGTPSATPSRLQLLAITAAGRRIGVNVVLPVTPR